MDASSLEVPLNLTVEASILDGGGGCFGLSNIVDGCLAFGTIGEADVLLFDLLVEAIWGISVIFEPFLDWVFEADEVVDCCDLLVFLIV